MSAINIIGFNAPEWNITFFGSIFARCLPVGIYTTNHKSVCQFIGRHSECKIVVAENYQLAEKYLDLLKDNTVKYIIIYGEKTITKDNFGGKIVLWKDFIERGKK